ncbi:uncharacterized protein METZ01_LOCUS376310 [marine metagenome]|uniref:Uncharacterized protein n=1 Tax=marine metagenome TaxID=408172 RepID=A0A382TN08_9ZZZZ
MGAKKRILNIDHRPDGFSWAVI